MVLPYNYCRLRVIALVDLKNEFGGKKLTGYSNVKKGGAQPKKKTITIVFIFFPSEVIGMNNTGNTLKRSVRHAKS